MNTHKASKRWIWRALSVVAFTSIAGGAISLLAQNQAGPAATPPRAAAPQNNALEFEVATVKRSGPRIPGRIDGLQGGPGTRDPIFMSATRVTLYGMLALAFKMQGDQISGPEWLQNELYDFAMKVPPNATKEQSLLMLQNLLVDRFNLTLHHAMKEFPVYRLVIGKNGSKLKETVLPDAKPLRPGPEMPLDKDGFPQLPPGVGGSIGRLAENGLFRRTFVSVSVENMLAGVGMEITGQYGNMGGRIVNETGLAGKYDFHLEYASAGGRLGAVSSSVDPAGGPDIFDAFEKQLGLRLQKSKAMFDTIVVDHAEKVPKDN